MTLNIETYMKCNSNNILKDNINNDLGIHNKKHNFMNKTLNNFNIIHPSSSIMKFHKGQILTQTSYGNFKLTKIIRERPEECGLHERKILYKPKYKSTNGLLYFSRFKNYFKLQDTLIEED